MKNEKCYICDWIAKRNTAEKKYYIGELSTGYIFLSNRWQYFKGYTFFLSKRCVSELHLLPEEFRVKFLLEMTIVAEAVQNTFNARKINCDASLNTG